MRVPISDLLSRNRLSITHSVYDLHCKNWNSSSGANVLPTITLSMAFRYIWRPFTKSFGSHHSLEDLPKIVANNRSTTLLSSPPASEMASPERPWLETNLDDCSFIDDDDDEEEEVYESKSLPREEMSEEVAARQPKKAHKRGLSFPDDALNGDVSSQSISSPKMTSTPKATNHVDKLTTATLKSLSKAPTAYYKTTQQQSTTKKESEAKLQMTLKYCRKNATLSVIVHRIKNLPITSGSYPNAYVKLRLIENILPGRSHRVNNTKKRTPTQKSNLNPVFEDTIHYLVLPHELRIRRLEVSVCHDGGRLNLGKNEVLSRFIVSLEQVQTAISKGEDQQTVSVTDWYSLPPDVNRST